MAGIFAGQDTAVHHRARRLRQCVLGVAGLQHGGHAGGAEHGVVAGILGKPLRGGGVVGGRGSGGDKAAHVLGVRAAQLGGAAEVVARHLVELHGESVVLEARERPGELIDRIARPRPRTVPAGVAHLELVAEVDLLARLHPHHHVPPLAQLAATRIGVQREGGPGDLRMVRQQPLDARAGGLLVRRQHHDQVALRPVARLAVADEVGDQHRRARLVVRGAPAVEVALLLGQREGVQRPVLRAGGDHVDVGHQQDRLQPRIGAAVAGDQIAELWLGPDHLHVLRRKARGSQPRRHRFGGGARLALRRLRSVDLDQVAEDLARERAVGLGGGGAALRLGGAR